ncbi:MAG: HEPN domain-containing protein [Bacteroidetes bacterium]|jgi:uncharacterized protein (UPF0332 family)|nr:HEPN domain-containing protein [Bacteroidota bacterium]
MNDSAAAHLGKSRDALRAGALLIDGDEAEAAINRAYYAIFHAAAAALAQAGEDIKTHKGTQNQFWLRFVETGLFPRSLARLVPQLRQERARADYDAFTRFDTAAASDLLGDARRFVEEVETLVRELEAGS